MNRATAATQGWIRPSQYLFHNHQRLYSPFARFPSRQVPRVCQRVQRRQFFGAIFNQKNWDDIRFTPWKRRLFIGSILVGGGTFLCIMWLHYFTVVVPFHKFPESVAKELRLAISFENFHMDPQKAAKHYQRAVYATGPAGMDPYSDECIGLRIRIVQFLEKYKQFDQAVEELKALRRDCVNWVTKNGREHFQDGRRTKVLEWAVRASVHLGELFATGGARDPEQAEEALVWAVDTLLREKTRREAEGTKEGEGDWVTGEQFGATIESLAHHYEEKGLFHLSAPLFLQAVTVCPSDTCHAATLMNNLASSLAQQRHPNTIEHQLPSQSADTSFISRLRARDSQVSVRSLTSPRPLSTQSASKSPETVSPDLSNPQEQGRRWAQMALAVASAVPNANRDEECEHAKCAALYNLGEIAERQKRNDEARMRYMEARKSAQDAAWEEGVTMAKMSIARLNKG